MHKYYIHNLTFSSASPPCFELVFLKSLSLVCTSFFFSHTWQVVRVCHMCVYYRFYVLLGFAQRLDLWFSHINRLYSGCITIVGPKESKRLTQNGWAQGFGINSIHMTLFHQTSHAASNLNTCTKRYRKCFPYHPFPCMWQLHIYSHQIQCEQGHPQGGRI